MATQICRLCGNLSTNNSHIFRTDGLKQKIETCLPVILSQPCLLPDTVCKKCVENVNSFYTFIKHCIENILILEAQYDASESCLKTKRKLDKGCSTSISLEDDQFHTDSKYKERSAAFQKLLDASEDVLNDSSHFKVQLVDYEDSDDESYHIELPNSISKAEQVGRKCLKRKMTDILPHRTKIFKFCSNRRRKNTQPKRLEPTCGEEENSNQIDDGGIIVPTNTLSLRHVIPKVNSQFDSIHSLANDQENDLGEGAAEVVCLLCDAQFTGSDVLSKHVLQTHGIDMARVISSEPVPETKQYQQVQEQETKTNHQPNITVQQEPRKKVRRNGGPLNGRRRSKAASKSKHTNFNSFETNRTNTIDIQISSRLGQSYVCPLCPLTLGNRTDLFAHLRLKHASKAGLICGLCYSADISSFYELHTHLEQCKKMNMVTQRYLCKVCSYSDDSSKIMEIHIAVHDFLVLYCKEERKLFDPEEYVEHNPLNAGTIESFVCTDCDEKLAFANLADYYMHKRFVHEIYNCDLCNKYYGRNSHLWKHVNRLHKGHPTVTCPICQKTSANKFHLAQHFLKAHGPRQSDGALTEDFLTKKFEPFDFQSVRQSFMRQDLADVVIKPDFESDQEASPKVLDNTSEEYTNILTNYSPKPEKFDVRGPYACVKCPKTFLKRSLLRKHRKNCRVRPQKDLLTRCKSCSRIFKDRQSLAKHLVNYHSEYTCEICSETVVSKCEIVSHIRFVHPNSKLFCELCGDILRTHSEMKAHLSDHDNSNVCQFCGDLIDSKIKLKMHILSLHRKILSLSCGICLKLFETQYILRDHVQICHGKELNRLSCTICGKKYGSKWKAFDHINKSHGRYFHPCRNCLVAFDSQASLEQHSCDSGQCGNSVKSAIVTSQDEKRLVLNGVNNSDEDSSIEADENRRDDNNYFEVKKEPQSEEEVEQDGDCSQDSQVVRTKMDGLIDLRKKMSLLEKRLVGDSVVGKREKLDDSFDNKDALLPNPPQMTAKTLPIHPPNTSAKRTVYVNDSNQPATCEICSKTWPAKKHLWQHYIRCHRQAAATVCGICLRMNDGYKQLQVHLAQAHEGLLYGRGYGSNFICRVCGRYHNARSKLRMHMHVHAGIPGSNGRGNKGLNLDGEENVQDEDDDKDEIHNQILKASLCIDNIKTEKDDNAEELVNDKEESLDKTVVNDDNNTGRTDGSTSNNSSDDENDSEDIKRDEVTLSGTSDSNANDDNTSSSSDDDDDIDSNGAVPETSEKRPCSAAELQLQLSNAVRSINDDLATMEPAEDEMLMMGVDSDVVVSSVGPFDLSHELQSAVDSIL